MTRNPRLALGFAAAPWVLLAGLACTGAGCTESGKPEEQKTTLDKVNDGAIKAEKAVGDATGSAVKATGKALEAGGEKLEHAAADSVKRNVGEKAGEIVESTGKALGKAGASVESGGDKLKEASQPTAAPDPVATPTDSPKITTPTPDAPKP